MGHTQKFGRNLDWCLVIKRTPVRAVGTLGTAGHAALGRRMISPTTETLEGAAGDLWEDKTAGSSGDAPDTG